MNELNLLRLQQIALAHREELVLSSYKKKKGLNGLCYVVSEAAYHLGLKHLGYFPYYLKRSTGTHWWLQQGNNIIDMAAPARFSYRNGTALPFLTKRPSRRAKLLINLYRKGRL